jgi:hypothetical protein
VDTATRRKFLAATAGLAATGWLPVAWGDTTDSLEIEVKGPEIVIRHARQIVCVYRYTASPRKPYVKELAPIGGENLLLDGPSDHLHHHGLMYAVRVNGVNFWEETAGCGFQKPAGLPEAAVESSADGQPRARIHQELNWVREADAERAVTQPLALLIERRTLELGVDVSSGSVELLWRSDFRPGPEAREVTLTGSNYNGLGVRFLRELDSVATHIIPGLPAMRPPDTQVVTPGDWGAVCIDAPGHPATLAIACSSRNPRVPGSVFSMTRPFVYLALTQSLDQAPLVLDQETRLGLAYRIRVTPGLEKLEQLQAWRDSR